MLSLPLSANALDDTQLWLWSRIKALDDGTNITLVEPQVRFQNDISEGQFIHLRLSQNRKINGWLQIGAGHSFLRRKINTHWHNENSTDLEGIVRHELFSLPVSHRFRLEYRIQETKPQNDFGRYRQQIQLFLPTIKEYHPFVIAEFFYHLEEDNFNQQRYMLGESHQLTEDLRAVSMIGLRRDYSGGMWSDLLILQFGLEC